MNIINGLISIEGVEGSGKTTLINLLKESELNMNNFVFVSEPGSTPKAIDYRKQIMENENITEKEKAILFAKARKSSYSELVLPSIEKGKIVLSDRSIFSSIVYQQFSDDVMENMDLICNLNKEIYPEFKIPGALILIDADPEKSLKRIHDNNRETNYFDELSIDFHKSIRSKYLELFELLSIPKIIISSETMNDEIYSVIEFIKKNNLKKD